MNGCSNDGRGDEGRFAALDGAPFPDFAPGSVWLVGAGPGAPGLLTLLGYHALCHADVVVHDALVGEAVLGFARPGTRRIYAGKRGGKPSAVQADITETLIGEARTGARVLRLKGGDPFMFGRGGEECEALYRAGIAYRVVPGISAGLGGLAYAGLPATHRDINQSVTFLTGHDLTGALPHAIDWPMVAKASPVVVMYMAAKHLPAIAQRLIAGGRAPDEPVAVIAHATLPDQAVIRLSLGEATTPRDLPTPAVVVLGRAVTKSESLEWFDAAASRGLFG
ncbi:uroporphyrinogen-III C-methyltransferase [Acuticoccus mangrovi]|uniref:uroporphyrinogen-III C-methyltransferase n=1 Tax=Acuticoccus mangrovi TaxID=2796142 RepID=A0A934MHV9_9HYPH|nr:uroporphyrinogen-III C-methyltransferase [Acuticoccus mangrovi]MBJ3777310.1 uroporphyrinogen-III C-methyltransferase [Acuticoccus mangrovi]